MKILNDYEGASIDIVKIDVKENIAYLSLKDENNKASHYYNFIVENNEDMEGVIFIKNIVNSPYYKKNSKNTPYIKINNNWERLKNCETTENEELKLTIKPHTKQEISLVPRYVYSDLEQFKDTINSPNIKFINSDTYEIIIGNINLPAVVFTARQHPGETLSSFFIEGVIQEILSNTKLLKKYCFVIYPFVNSKGVKNGNHRYTNAIDYNRSWNKKDAPNEIKNIKKKLDSLNVAYFVDVHNDEITKENYIRTPCKNIKNKIAGIKVLKSPSKFKRFARALIKQKKIINIFSMTSNEYVFKKYHCKTFLIELSMFEEYSNIGNLGKKFIKELLGE